MLKSCMHSSADHFANWLVTTYSFHFLHVYKITYILNEFVYDHKGIAYARVFEKDSFIA